MTAIYGHRWTSPFGETPEDGAGALTLAGDTWSRGLAGLTPQEIGAGVAACLTCADEWPPTLPRFRALCLGIPALASVRREIQPGHPGPSAFTRMVWQFLDPWEFRRASAQEADRMLRDAYEAAREARLRGAPLPEASAELPAPEPQARTPASPEVAAQHLAELAALVGA